MLVTVHILHGHEFNGRGQREDLVYIDAAFN